MSESLGTTDSREGYREVEFGPKTLVVPKDWTVKQFGEVFDRRNESIDDEDEGSLKYIGLKHINSGELNIAGYDEDGRDRSSSRVFREGDVLFGKLRPNLNKAAIAPFDGVCSSDIIPMYAEDDTLNQYLRYLIHSKIVRDRVVSTMEGTNLPRTSWNDLKSTIVPIPPKEEQRRIVDVLSTVNERIQETQQSIKKAEELRQGLSQDLVLGEGLADDYKTVRLGAKREQIPVDWDIETFSDVADVEKGNTPKTSNDDYYGGDITWVTPDDLSGLYERGKKYISDSDRKLTPEGLDSTSVNIVDAPSVMFTSRSYGIGKTAICTTPAATNQGIIAFHCGDEMGEEYLYYYLNYIMPYIISISGVSTFPEVSLTDIRELKVPVPTESDRQYIENVLTSAEDKLVDEKSTKQTLQELKRGLMQDLLTGKRRLDTGT